ncbi:GreA/GreB family elongation factor [Mariniflexile litorale]|uniref:GreA/GreB family elongation factor n=1 Tax=Mariniflexile litorale TaxID=3045158 RepID=A0AAU7EDV6_9FLAO|nr:GreA/GreB family elongation factor [Mariniflexile sp. KMM 9835]MDQ8212337.1 GreA/GreB family elongation factor [Mariniflexile sp. KMM 9835]
MSRGFVKEDDQEETPIIPPRAALPEGVTNYITPFGLQLLLTEKENIEEERANLNVQDEQERRRDLAVINGRLTLLQERVASARVLQPHDQVKDEVRFAATVIIKMNKQVQEFQIVGVDEADVKQQKIAFIAPIARVITGKKVGDQVDFQLGNDIRKIEIVEISYR